MITFLQTIKGDIAFDAVINEDITASSVITSHPIETGAIVNDHIYKNPKVYILQGGVTNTPMFNSAGAFFNQDVFSEFGNSEVSRKVNAWEILNDIHAAGECFLVNAGLEVMTEMLIESLTASDNADLSGSLIFTATLKQIIVVDTVESMLTAEQLKGLQTKQQATTNKEKGKVTKKAVDSSIAISVLRFFGFVD